jgi:hypothetical protein
MGKKYHPEGQENPMKNKKAAPFRIPLFCFNSI